jgi:hypothetical protein
MAAKNDVSVVCLWKNSQWMVVNGFNAVLTTMVNMPEKSKLKLES